MSDKGLDEEEEYWFSYSAALRIFGDNVDFEEISQRLGLEPTHTHKKGDPVSIRRKKFFEHDMWSYEAPVEEERPLDEHLQALWADLKPHKEYLLDLKKHFRVDIFCSYRTNCTTAGFNVSPSSLQMFIELDLPFDVSVMAEGDQLRQALQRAQTKQSSQ